MNDYYPFGLTMPGRSANTANPNDNYKFTGYERDDEAGLTLDYANARTYDPIIGRFMGIDPLLQFSSPYTYVGNNPIAFLDPDGLWAVHGSYASRLNKNYTKYNRWLNFASPIPLLGPLISQGALSGNKYIASQEPSHERPGFFDHINPIVGLFKYKPAGAYSSISDAQGIYESFKKNYDQKFDEIVFTLGIASGYFDFGTDAYNKRTSGAGIFSYIHIDEIFQIGRDYSEISAINYKMLYIISDLLHNMLMSSNVNIFDEAELTIFLNNIVNLTINDGPIKNEINMRFRDPDYKVGRYGDWEKSNGNGVRTGGWWSNFDPSKQ